MMDYCLYCCLNGPLMGAMIIIKGCMNIEPILQQLRYIKDIPDETLFTVIKKQYIIVSSIIFSSQFIVYLLENH